MIISHKYKFIFIAIPKTGTTSIEESLKSRIELKIDNYNIFKHDICPEEKRDHKIRKHSTAKEIKEVLGEKIYNSYFKFCFVRNPWDRLVSIYYEAKKPTNCSSNFQNGKEDPWYIHQIKAKELSFKDYLFYFKDEWENYISMISDDNWSFLVNFIGKIENINDDFRKICNIIGLRKMELPILNKSGKNNYASYYDNEAKELVRSIHRKDICLFDYKFI